MSGRIRPKIIILVLFNAVLSLVQGGKIYVPQKTYSCQENGGCQLNDPNTESSSRLSQSACLVTCGQGNLWPSPTGEVSIGKAVSYFTSASNVQFTSLQGSNVKWDNLLSSIQKNFLKEVQVLQKPSRSPNARSQPSLLISIEGKIADGKLIQPSPENDESYSLIINTDKDSQKISVKITSSTIFGYRHGLETVLQLIFWDDIEHSLGIVNTVTIQDRPSFSYRGIMIDVSRNFISLSKLQESIRALGYNKMNVLHLHLSDTASFPVTIPSRPNITAYGAYDDERIFTKENIENLVSFAATYGVMLLPEVDTPAHVSAGWQWGKDAGLGNLILCDDPYGHEAQSWNEDALEPPSGQLNLGNENVYPVLNDVYRDIIEQIPSPYFHLGGDEVIVGSDETWASCYNSSVRGAEVIAYIEKLGLPRSEQSTFYGLWENFTIRATDMIQNIYKEKNIPLTKLHIWGGGGVDDSGVCYNLLAQDNVKDYLPPKLFTIQVWDDSSDSIVPNLIQQGYQVILSNTDYVYLDCGNAGSTNPGGYWCQPYHEWFHIYQYINDIKDKWLLTDDEIRKGIIGSETLIWTEMVDDINLSQKLWPRSAALAEALWTNPKHGWYEANARFQQWRNTLVQRGIAAEALQPLWCQQREGWVCSLNSGEPGTAATTKASSTRGKRMGNKIGAKK